MGHRANFVVIRDGAASAFYDQWAALGCLLAFADGPEEALKAVGDMEETGELLDWAFAEGGYLLDFDSKTAITFGFIELPEEIGDDFPKTVAELAAALDQGGGEFLRQIAPRWTGWLLQWDDRGVDAFSAHLKKRDIQSIICEPPSHPENPSFAEIRAA